jgi:uncharacterized protein (TIGR00369 family)
VSSRRLEVSWEDPAALATEGMKRPPLDFLSAIRDGELPTAPISRLLGFDLVEVEEGRAVFAAEPGERHYNPIGVVHAGLAATMLDSAMACAVHSALPEGSGYTTLETKFNLVRSITAETGRIEAEGKVVNLGRRVGTAEGRLVAAGSGKLLAHGTSTCLVVELP